MNKKIKFLVPVLVFLVLLVPTVVMAEKSELVPCDGANCDFGSFMKLVNNFIDFVFLKLALPISAIMFVYAGGLLVTSGGSTESRTKAKSIFTNTVIGLVLAAAAWLIVRTILTVLGFDGGWI